MDASYSNIIGFWSFYKKEVRRFLSVWGQTILSPLVTSSLFLLIFDVSIGTHHNADVGYTYLQFLVPGIIMMMIIQNAFANSSSSIFISKMQGNIVDILMSPMSPFVVILVYTLAAVTRGIMIGLLVYFFALLFTELPVPDLFWATYFLVLAGACLGLVGTIGGIVSAKMDQLASFSTIVIMPLSFLSGTFYSIERLPGYFQTFSGYNPFFFLIDGFRYSFIGESDLSIYASATSIFIIFCILFIIAWVLWTTGYKLKS